MNKIRAFIEKINIPAAAKFAGYLLVWINQILVSTGHPVLPITSDELNQEVSLWLTIMTNLVAYFDNNPILKKNLRGGETKHAVQK
ncbi:phage holin [Lactiplantibacillus paraxiangfangensis]|uniref:phage holin n=1 Tax=Lactiplantibacillus paraxiangfangensis TaxID=3076224 RepID=UPI0030C71BE4